MLRFKAKVAKFQAKCLCIIFMATFKSYVSWIRLNDKIQQQA